MVQSLTPNWTANVLNYTGNFPQKITFHDVVKSQVLCQKDPNFSVHDAYEILEIAQGERCASCMADLDLTRKPVITKKSTDHSFLGMRSCTKKYSWVCECCVKCDIERRIEELLLEEAMLDVEK